MGVIKRQGIKQSAVRYFGIGIGFLSTVFIYPLLLEEIGLLRFIQNTALMIAHFFLLGGHVIAVRYFPHFRDEGKSHNGFLFLLLLWTGVGYLLFLGLYTGFNDAFFHFFRDQPEDYLQYLPYIVPLVLLMLYIQLFTDYASNFHRIVVPFLLNELIIKLSLPILILLLYWHYLDLNWVIDGMLLAYGAVLAGIVGYIAWLGELRLRPHLGFLTRKLWKEMGSFALFNVLGTWGFILANRIDIFMLGLLLGAENWKGVGIYSINLFISEVIDAPRKALDNIASPIVADSWKREDRPHLQELYERSSLNQTAVGLLIFLLIWASLPDLFALMPNGTEVATGLWVMCFLGLGKVVDMATGINSLIIQHSRYYRFNFYATLMLAGLNILNNLWLIPLLGMTGAALATLLSVVLFNLAKFLFLRIRLGMQPFSRSTLGILAVAALAFGLGYLIPNLGEGFLLTVTSIALRSLLIATVFVSLLLYFNLAPDLHDLARQGLERARKLLRRR